MICYYMASYSRRHGGEQRVQHQMQYIGAMSDTLMLINFRATLVFDVSFLNAISAGNRSATMRESQP